MELVEKVNISWLTNADGWCLKSTTPREGFHEINETALIVNGYGDGYCMFFEKCEFGPIISNETIEGVKTKFDEALTLMLTIKSLMSINGMKEKFLIENMAP